MTVRRLGRAAGVVALFGIVSRLLGLVREQVLVGVYGTSATLDGFVNALFLVNTVAALLLYVLVTLVIPTFQQEEERAGERSAWQLLWAIAFWVGVALVALGSVVAIWPGIGGALFAGNAHQTAVTESLLRIMAPGLALQGLSAIATALLQIRGRFAGPAAVGVAFNAGILLSIAVLHGRIGIDAAGWGVTLGAVLQIVLQAPQFARLARREGVRPALMHPRIGAVAVAALPVVGASALQQVNNFTDKLFATSFLDSGANAALNAANSLGSAPRTALLFPLLTPLFPHVARSIAQRRPAEALQAFHRSAGLLCLVAVPMAAFMALYAHEIVQVIYQRHACGRTCTTRIAGPLVWYSLAIWANFLGYLVNRVLSAAGRFRDIMVATLVSVPLTIGLDLVLIGPLDQSGLALASAIAVTANTAITLWMMRREFPGLGLRRLGIQQARLIACGGIAAGVLAALDLPLPSGGRGSVATAGLVAIKGVAGCAAYLLALRALAPAELAGARRTLREVLGRRRRTAPVG